MDYFLDANTLSVQLTDKAGRDFNGNLAFHVRDYGENHARVATLAYHFANK